jgi:hypothetical protein
MKQFNTKIDIFVKENSEINAFCVSARIIVENFIAECATRNVTPSYDFFTVWMDTHPNSIT